VAHGFPPVTQRPYASPAVSRLPLISPAAYRRITFIALLALGFIIVTGGAVRLTGSGLGCPEFPNCEPGSLVPTDPTDTHGMVEFVNRTITGLVSATVVLAVLGSLRRNPRRRDLTWLSLGLVAGVVGQIALGGLTVIFELSPPLVMGHFLLSLVLIANAVVLHHRAGAHDGPGIALLRGATATLVRRVLPLAAAVAVVSGTVVTGTGPHGGDADVRRFGFDIDDVARVHSLSVIAFIALVLVVLTRFGDVGAAGGGRGVGTVLTRRAQELLAVAVAQAAVGYAQYLTDVPVVLVGIHILGATLVWAAVVRLVVATTARGANAPPDGTGDPAEARAAGPDAPPVGRGAVGDDVVLVNRST
jgi:cytochrome c oxidase assembly protein subunit 15